MKQDLLLLSLFLWTVSFFSFAQIKTPQPTRAKWTISPTGPIVSVALDSHLTPRQIKLIQSGFSTFSIIEIRDYQNRDSLDPAHLIGKVSCTVKYDTWQEDFELAQINDRMEAKTVKTYRRYADLCLRGVVVEPEVIKRFAKEGGQVVVSLYIDQIAASKAEEIKEWLIRQQSGVMQGLFSHMLGDLKSSQRIDLIVTVPSNRTASH